MTVARRQVTQRFVALQIASLALCVLLSGVAAAQQGFTTEGFGQTPHFEDAGLLPLRDVSQDDIARPESNEPIPETESPQSEAEIPLATADGETGTPPGSSFGSPGAFGSESGAGSFSDTGSFGEATWSQPDGSPAPAAPFFIHDQLLKLLALLGMSAAALVVILTRRFVLRRWVLLLSIGTLGFALGGFLCPLTAVQNIFLKWTTGYILLFAVPVGLSLLLGRVFCGYVCPFGAIQEWLHVRRWSVRLPHRVNRVLRWMKVALLIYLVARVIATGMLTLAGETPFKALFQWGGTPLTIAITAITAALSVVLYRPFCAYGCPLGAFLAVVSRFSLFRLKKDENCTSCGLCTSSCASDVCDAGDVNSSDCLLCGACQDVCPTSCLRIRLRGRGSRRKREPRPS